MWKMFIRTLTSVDLLFFVAFICIDDEEDLQNIANYVIEALRRVFNSGTVSFIEKEHV